MTTHEIDLFGCLKKTALNLMSETKLLILSLKLALFPVVHISVNGNTIQEAVQTKTLKLPSMFLLFSI